MNADSLDEKQLFEKKNIPNQPRQFLKNNDESEKYTYNDNLNRKRRNQTKSYGVDKYSHKGDSDYKYDSPRSSSWRSNDRYQTKNSYTKSNSEKDNDYNYDYDYDRNSRYYSHSSHSSYRSKNSYQSSKRRDSLKDSDYSYDSFQNRRNNTSSSKSSYKDHHDDKRLKRDDYKKQNSKSLYSSYLNHTQNNHFDSYENDSIYDTQKPHSPITSHSQNSSPRYPLSSSSSPSPSSYLNNDLQYNNNDRNSSSNNKSFSKSYKNNDNYSSNRDRDRERDKWNSEKQSKYDSYSRDSKKMPDYYNSKRNKRSDRNIETERFSRSNPRSNRDHDTNYGYEYEQSTRRRDLSRESIRRSTNAFSDSKKNLVSSRYQRETSSSFSSSNPDYTSRYRGDSNDQKRNKENEKDVLEKRRNNSNSSLSNDSSKLRGSDSSKLKFKIPSRYAKNEEGYARNEETSANPENDKDSHLESPINHNSQSENNSSSQSTYNYPSKTPSKNTSIDKPVNKEPLIKINGSIYRRVAQVGEGTYGRVYKAVNQVTKKLVALKRIRMESEREGFPITALREIKLLQHLLHDNIVCLNEMMVERANVYMVFEYMDHDLTGILTHPTYRLKKTHLKHIFMQILEGLSYLHHRGVLHRDMKGSNILLNNEGTVKLADFGLARFFDKEKKGLDYTNRVITLWYRPPELLLGATIYGPCVDNWGAGCIMVELFTQKAIFQGQDEISQLESIYNVMGTPTIDNWPSVTMLPWYDLLKPRVPKPSIFRRKFEEKLTPAALDLAIKLLSYDPSRRLSAADALKHDYFLKEEPTPEKPDNLRDLGGEWHEFESKRRRKRDREKFKIMTRRVPNVNDK